jgi:hypothetical protein
MQMSNETRLAASRPRPKAVGQGKLEHKRADGEHHGILIRRPVTLPPEHPLRPGYDYAGEWIIALAVVALGICLVLAQMFP